MTIDPALVDRYSFVLASSYRKKVILSIEKKPKTPKEISEEKNVYLVHISRALRELTKKGLTICVTPKKVKGRLYQLTVDGEKILEYLKM